MENKFIKNLSDEEKAEFDEVAQVMFKAMIPGILRELISNELLDKQRINDKEYVITALKENYEKIKLPNLQVATSKTLRETLESEIKADREISAVIIAGVCIEHLLNHFYQDLLPIKYGMDNKNVASALNSIGISDKIGWFLKITTNNEAPEGLKGKIININNIRNKAVHYKAIPEDLDVDGSGSHNEIKRKLESLKLEQLLDTTTELEEFLDDLILKVDDNYRLAFDICNKHLF